MSNPQLDHIAELIDQYNDMVEEKGWKLYAWLENITEDEFNKRIEESVTEEGDLELLEELEPWPDPEDYAETSQGCDIDEEA